MNDPIHDAEFVFALFKQIPVETNSEGWPCRSRGDFE